VGRLRGVVVLLSVLMLFLLAGSVAVGLLTGEQPDPFALGVPRTLGIVLGVAAVLIAGDAILRWMGRGGGD
jgi:hypothetical protein